MTCLPLSICLLLSIHYCEPHGAWHEDVTLASSAAVWALDVVLRVSTLVKRLEVLNLWILLGLLVAVVSHISSVWRRIWTHRALLIVAVEVLDVQRTPSLVLS